jgi:hypothetical protein
MPDEGQPANDLLGQLGLQRREESGGATPPPPPEQPQNPPEGQKPPEGGQAPPEGQKPPEQPQGLGDEGLTALQREREARRDAERQFKELRENVEFERAQAQRSERQKLEAERDRALKKAEASDQTILRIRVAAEKNLTPGLALRLQGATEAEMKADADRLLEEVGGLPRPSTFDGGARGAPAVQKSPEQAHQELILGLLGRGNPEQPT